MAAHSTRQAKPKKPRPDFPLFPHQRGYWAKKVRGNLAYFGKVADDPKGEAALNKWLDQKDDLLAGRRPRSTPAIGLTVADLCNHYATAKEQQRDAGDITGRSFAEYFANCGFVVASFGRTRLVDDLAADDFQSLRAKLAKLYGVHKLSKEIQLTRMIFKYGVDAGLIDKPVRFGPTFKKPANRIMRAHRQKNGHRMFEAVQLRTIIDTADQPLKAMIFLGINCGFGNHDCGMLPRSAVDLEVPSRKFPKAKKKIPSRKFPKSQRKIPSRKFPKAPAAVEIKHDAQVPLGRPTNEEGRQVRLAALTGQMKSVLPASKLQSDS